MTAKLENYIAELSASSVGPDSRLRRLPGGPVLGCYQRCELTSVFQPVVNLQTHSVFAMEGLISSRHGEERGLSPWGVFAQAASDTSLIELDRLCRTVHVLNHFSGPERTRPLIVNVHDRLLSAVADDHGRAFRRVLDSLGIPPRSLIIETPERVADSVDLLCHVMANYRLNGFAVSISVTSAKQASEILAHMRPDYLKLDSRRVESPETLSALVRETRSEGVWPIFQRVETPAQLEAIQQAGGRYAQGHLLGVPAYPKVGLELEAPAA
ncbi:EAL domain-containing protein [Niveibacterium sp.]|uniref:EAL domain-containing protein n=1 Tax=Niveibacterium sp. TaxID=2017444 RepID=UPI0035B0942F